MARLALLHARVVLMHSLQMHIYAAFLKVKLFTRQGGRVIKFTLQTCCYVCSSSPPTRPTQLVALWAGLQLGEGPKPITASISLPRVAVLHAGRALSLQG